MENKVEKMPQRSLSDFYQDLKFFRSNKLSIVQSKTFFAGLTYELILNTVIFPKNSDLKVVIPELYLKYNKRPDDRFYRDYLYKSRTQLASRVTRNVIDFYDYNVIKSIASDIEDILLTLNPDLDRKPKNQPQSSFSANINAWIKAISETNKHE